MLSQLSYASVARSDMIYYTHDPPICQHFFQTFFKKLFASIFRLSYAENQSYLFDIFEKAQNFFQKFFLKYPGYSVKTLTYFLIMFTMNPLDISYIL